MSIYLGSNKLQLNLGGTGIGEAYLGGVKVLGEVPLPVIGAKTIRIQFTDVSYDPSISQWSDSSTWASKGWTLVKRKSSPNIWDFTHTAELPNDALYPLRSYSGGAGTHPPQAPYAVTDINTSGWTNFTGLFSGHTLLTEVPLFNISSGTIDYLFDQAQSLSNDIAWAKRLATTRAIYTLTTFITNTPNKSSIPTAFGGTKGRTRIVSKAGGANVSENLTITLRPGDYIYTSCRGYQSNNASFKSNCYLKLPPSSGTAMANNSQYSSTYLIYAKASGSTGSKVTDETTIRWGYAEGTRMTCTGYRASYNANNPYANLYVDSFQFI